MYSIYYLNVKYKLQEYNKVFLLSLRMLSTVVLQMFYLLANMTGTKKTPNLIMIQLLNILIILDPNTLYPE